MRDNYLNVRVLFSFIVLYIHLAVFHLNFVSSTIIYTISLKIILKLNSPCYQQALFETHWRNKIELLFHILF